jgi:hypothetical protein
MESTIDISLIKDIVNRLDPSIAGQEDDPGYRTAVVLLAAASSGPVVGQLINVTGYGDSFINEIAARMRLAGLWTATNVKSDHWLAEDGHTILSAAFWTDVLVAEGLLIAQPEGSTIRYWAVKSLDSV